MIPEQTGRGRPRAKDRTTINAILYVLTTGCRWDDLQRTQYRNCYTTAWRRFKMWEEQGLWKRIMDAVISKAYSSDTLMMDSLSIDSSTVPAKKWASW